MFHTARLLFYLPLVTLVTLLYVLLFYLEQPRASHPSYIVKCLDWEQKSRHSLPAAGIRGKKSPQMHQKMFIKFFCWIKFLLDSISCLQTFCRKISSLHCLSNNLLFLKIFIFTVSTHKYFRSCPRLEFYSAHVNDCSQLSCFTHWLSPHGGCFHSRINTVPR